MIEEETLIDFFMRAPFPEIDLDLSRDKDLGVAEIKKTGKRRNKSLKIR